MFRGPRIPHPTALVIGSSVLVAIKRQEGSDDDASYDPSEDEDQDEDAYDYSTVSDQDFNSVLERVRTATAAGNLEEVAKILRGVTGGIDADSLPALPWVMAPAPPPPEPPPLGPAPAPNTEETAAPTTPTPEPGLTPAQQAFIAGVGTPMEPGGARWPLLHGSFGHDFHGDLEMLYRLSKEEGVHTPPGEKNYGNKDAFVIDGVEVFRGQRGKVALWIKAHAGQEPDDQRLRELKPIVAGSQAIRSALTRIRLHFTATLQLSEHLDMPHHVVIAALAQRTYEYFVNARLRAARPRPAPSTASRVGAAVARVATGYGLPLLKMAINVLVAMAAIMALGIYDLTPERRGVHRAGAELLLPLGAALAPAILALASLACMSTLCWFAQAPRRTSTSPSRGRPPGWPGFGGSSDARDVRSLRELRRDAQRDASTASYFSQIRSAVDALRRPTRLPLAVAIVSSPGFLALSVPFIIMSMFVLCFFMLGSRLLGTTHAFRPHHLDDLSSFASRAPAALRTAARVTGGTARYIRRVPWRIIIFIASVTTLLYLPYGIPSSAQEAPPSLPQSYRADCEFTGGIHFSFTSANDATPSAGPVGHGRALLKRDANGNNDLKLTKTTLRALLNRRRTATRRGPLRLVLDSGCTMSCHPYAEDLINQRPSRETMSGIDGIKRQVRLIGDLPIVARDSNGKLHRLLIRGVRCVPEFTDTLISVDRLWEETRSEVRFADHRKVFVPYKHGTKLKFPFAKAADGLFVWDVIAAARQADQPTARSLAATESDFDKVDIHRARSTGHLRALHPHELAAHLHHRLHVSPSILQRLPRLSRDVPDKLHSHTSGSPCIHCTEANAQRLPHNSDGVYRSSYPGRLVHGDIVGPFKTSAIGSFQYALVLVDDHTRYKFVRFLKKKSDALKEMRLFVANFNAKLNVGNSAQARSVGSLKLDNAGEFLSHQFKEFLADELIDQTTCPPHVHSLNGVAERAIRSIVENARSHMIAANCPIGFWPYAFEHAVDVLNRVTGPTDSGASSFELLENLKPKVLPIQPFGCRTVVVRPRHTYSKRTIDPHGEKGINLGRSPTIVNAFRVWIPSRGAVVTTSEIYFDATQMPWRADGDQRVGPASALPPPLDDVEGAVAVDRAEPPTRSSDLATSFDQANRGDHATARHSHRVLVLYSGPYRRPDGLGAFLNKFGMEAELVDNHPVDGGGDGHDLLNDAFFQKLMQRVGSGYYSAIFAAPPCSTFSISRFYPKNNSPPVVRRRAPSSIHGTSDVPPAHRRELADANALVARTCQILELGWSVGTQFILENPVDRGDRAKPRSFLHEDHGSIWQMPEIIQLAKVTGALTVDFSQCMIGAPWQKRTTLMYTGAFEDWLLPLAKLDCDHSSHKRAAGGMKDLEGEWNSSEAAAYPPQLNLYLAKTIVSLHSSNSSTRPTPAAAMPTPAPAPKAANPSSPATGAPQAQDDEGVNLLSPSNVARSPAVGLNLPDSPPSARQAEFSAALDSASPTAPPPAAVERDKKIWGTRLERGDDIKRSLRSASASGRAMLALSNALLVLSPWHGRANLAATATADPQSRDQALRMDRDGWTESMQAEYDGHLEKESWEWVRVKDVPKGRHLVKLVWVFKVKRSGKLKSRLCVQGCAQTAGVDYNQTYSAALRSSSLRVLASLAARTGYRMRRWDFVAAYLQGRLEPGEVVYCHAPQGFPKKDAEGFEMCCKVIKPIYGMAQAGRRWQRTLFPWLEEFGFKKCQHDSCIFKCEKEVDTPDGPRKEVLTLGVYVDDLVTLYFHDDEHSLYQQFATELQKWDVEDEGELTDLLGVDFSFDGGVVSLTQTQYINRLAETYMPDGVASTVQSNQLPHGPDLPQHVADALVNTDAPDPAILRSYQSLVGALLYCATNTRPDICYAVGMLCRAMSRPTPELLVAAERVLGYLIRTKHIGLRFEASERPLHGYSDSDWATQHSTSGWVFMLNQAAVAWGSKKQKSVALSSCEAEIVAASEAAKEAVHLSELTRELGLGTDVAPDMFIDNKSAIDVAYNPQHHGRMKHVERRHFFVRELVEEHKIRCPFVSTVDNLADFFTKPLRASVFFPMRDRIMNVSVGDRPRGGVVPNSFSRNVRSGMTA